MSENSMNSVCIICNVGATSSKRLINNPVMIAELVSCSEKRLLFDQSDIKQLHDSLVDLSEAARNSVYYHSECWKPIVDKTLIERLMVKQSLPETQTCLTHRRGLPPSVSDSARPKRAKTIPKAQVCLFLPCSFRSNDTSDLHRVFSDRVGEHLIEIKAKTQDDWIRTCVSDLEGVEDASALEKYCHRKCLQSSQRTFTLMHHSNDQVIRSICDAELIRSIQNTLTDSGVTLNMAEVSAEYLSILKRYPVEVGESTNLP